MVYSSQLCVLIALSADFLWGIDLDMTRRAQDSTTHGNPFLSIAPSNVLHWSSCFQDSPASDLGSISCARLLAPLDYTNPSLGTVQLAIIKLKGPGTGDAVFYNPGGAGDDPVEDILSNAAILRAYVGKAPDIIAVVPRGVGATFPPITCDVTNLIATRRNWEIQDTLPGYTRPSLCESYAIGESVGLDCAMMKPDLVPFVGTVSAAHDMEFVRHALGQKQLSYLGFSYGTVLGGTYAALFPSRVGRMVLDGVLDFNDWYISDKDPSLDIGDADLALDHFFRACHEAGAHSCAIWSKSIEDIRKRFHEADQRIYDKPLPAAGYGILKWPLWRSGEYSALYTPSEGFPLLAGATSEILDGSAGPYIQAYLTIVQTAATAPERWPIDAKTGLKNSPNAGTLISCSDGGAASHKFDTDQLDAKFSKYQKVSKFFAGVSAQDAFIISPQRRNKVASSRISRQQILSYSLATLLIRPRRSGMPIA